MKPYFVYIYQQNEYAYLKVSGKNVHIQDDN